MQQLLPHFARFALLSATLFAGRSVLTKSNALDLSPANLLMWQGVMSVPLLWVIARANAIGIRPNLSLWRLYAARVGFGIANLLLLFIALTHLPTTIASTLGFTAPIFVAAFAPALLGEKTTLPILGGILVGFIGISISAAPHMAAAKSWFLLVGLAAGLSSALMQIFARKLARLGEAGLRTVFWLNVAAGITGTVWSFLEGFEKVSFVQLALAFGIALLGVSGQVTSVSAFKRGPPLTVNGLSFLMLPIAALLAYVFLGERTSLQTLGGMMITIGACIYLLQAEQRRLKLAHDTVLELTAADIREERAQLQQGGGAQGEPLFVAEPTAAEVDAEQHARPLQHDPHQERAAATEKLAA